jgi:hypothetical protein
MLIELGSFTFELIHTRDWKSWHVYLRLGHHDWHLSI